MYQLELYYAYVFWYHQYCLRILLLSHSYLQLDTPERSWLYCFWVQTMLDPYSCPNCIYSNPQTPTWYRHWTCIGSVFPWKLNDSKVNLSSPFGPRSRISKVSSRIHPSLINFHVGKFESYKRFLNFQISRGYLFYLLLHSHYIIEKKTKKPSLLEPYFQWDRVQKCM